MTVLANTDLTGELRKFGAFDVTACYNCGNCTAVCPLSAGDAGFPRRMIRYGQIGDRARLLASREVWLCYYCGECSDTCPRQAEPGEFMAAARRCAIASLDPTGISRLLYTSKLFTALFVAALTILLTLILLSQSGPMAMERPDLFGFIPFDVVHDVGLATIVIAVIFAVVGVARLSWQLISSRPVNGAAKQQGLPRRLISAARYVAAELVNEKRYRTCEEEAPPSPWYRSRWFMHWAIMWGFLGLAAATAIDYILLLVAAKVPGQPEPLWHPTRLLGTLTGLLVLFGVTKALIARFQKPTKYASHSLLSDWLFLWLLLIVTLTGFVVELAIYLPEGTVWGYVLFLIHVVLGMEIVLLFPFTKFAHAIYRPVALFIHHTGAVV